MGSFLSDERGSLTLNLKLRSMTNHLLADDLDWAADNEQIISLIIHSKRLIHA